MSKITEANVHYAEFLHDIKSRIQQARIRAFKGASRELVDLYWHIGSGIVERQERYGWGKAVVERLSRDLQKDYPGVGGFSAPNLWFMRQLYLEYHDYPNLLQLVREIPWGQNIMIMTKAKDTAQRQYYLKATAELGWSRNVLLNQIKGQAFERHRAENKQHNFDVALPEHLAEHSKLRGRSFSECIAAGLIKGLFLCTRHRIDSVRCEKAAF